MIANMVLIALRFFLADLSGSIGLEANAWHSFADLFVTTIVFVGLLVTSFGKERLGKAVNTVEHILALFVSLFIFYMGFEILESALSSEAIELRYVPFTDVYKRQYIMSKKGKNIREKRKDKQKRRRQC